MSDFPSQKQDKFVLRLPDGMRDQIKAQAEKSSRSMNAEIIARLESSLSSQEVNQISLLSLVIEQAFKNPQAQINVTLSTDEPTTEDQKLWIRRIAVRLPDGSAYIAPSPKLD